MSKQRVKKAAVAPDALPRGERAELRRQGAKAAARGEKMASNPMRKHKNMPEATGESAHTWQQRDQAWQQGHEAQSDAGDAQRNPPAAEEHD